MRKEDSFRDASRHLVQKGSGASAAAARGPSNLPALSARDLDAAES